MGYKLRENQIAWWNELESAEADAYIMEETNERGGMSHRWGNEIAFSLRWWFSTHNLHEFMI